MKEIDYGLEVCDMCHFQYDFHQRGDLQACLRAANKKLALSVSREKPF